MHIHFYNLYLGHPTGQVSIIHLLQMDHQGWDMVWDAPKFCNSCCLWKASFMPSEDDHLWPPLRCLNFLGEGGVKFVTSKSDLKNWTPASHRMYEQECHMDGYPVIATAHDTLPEISLMRANCSLCFGHSAVCFPLLPLTLFLMADNVQYLLSTTERCS